MKKRIISSLLSLCLLANIACATMISDTKAAKVIYAQDIKAAAMSLCGKYKYVWGGESPSEGGFDCTGLIYYIYHDMLGYDMTLSQIRSTAETLKMGTKIYNKEDLLPGDIVEYPGHSGIYIGNKTVIHSGVTYGVSKVSINTSALKFNYGVRLKNVYQTRVQHTITFDPEGGSVHPTSITVPEGSNNWELPTPTRSGYKFRGWGLYSNGSAGNVIVDYPWTITEDMTLYATWTEECASHSYKTVERNGQYTAVCKSCNKEFALGSLDTSVKGTYKPASGYVTLCSAPYQDADVKPTKGEVQVIGSVTNAYGSVWYKTSDGYWILGKYLKKVEAKSYAIYFDAEGGKVNTGSMVVTNGKTFGNLPTPTRSGYIFNGWMYDDAKSGVCVRVDSSTKVNLSGDTTLYAIWSKEKCTSHTKGDYLYCDESHPHYNYYECANCGEEFTDKKVNQVSGCKTCNPEPEKCTSHTKGSYLFYEASHPHYYYYECANCGARFTDGTTREMDSCTTCNPPKKEPVWGAWSGWSTSKVSATATRQVETRQVKVSDAYTEYRYGRYVSNGHDCWCRTYLASRPYYNGSISTEYSSWSTRRYSIYDTGWTCGECNGNHSGYYESDGQGREFWHEYRIGGKSYWWEESRTTPAQYRTEYRYRELG